MDEWTRGPSSCGEQEARAAGQVAHPHDSAECAEDMLERAQASQQAWRSKMEDYLVAMGVASQEILEPQIRLECGTSEVRASQAGCDDWSEGLGAHKSIPLQWMGGPGSCREHEARAAVQVAHRHDSAEWAEDKHERVQDSQQTWRSKMEDYLVAMGGASLETHQTHLRTGRQSRAGRT